MDEAGEDCEGEAPGDVVVVGVEQPVPLPAAAAKHQDGEKHQNSWKTITIGVHRPNKVTATDASKRMETEELRHYLK